MPDARETTHMDGNCTPVNFAPKPILTYQLPKNPCIFSGDDQQDAKRWLNDFERIAAYNHWDEYNVLHEIEYNNKEEHDSTRDIASMVREEVIEAIAPLFLDTRPLNAQSQLSGY
ncbi:uncharacterized protein TNIN_304291 [Trichonephila inaurata madagascariensis]|uniref:Uncharacterized protein n=1 Tax=Trichonephila inaurata madagascariensis TaxID=2747483 RepID=A0A8X6IEF9_9ARAC|nr:uncharacterized protein TNIN_304291 [Trichonephila inaurata madagascariensis]